MEVKLISENRACELIDFLTSEKGRYNYIAVVAATWKISKEVINDLDNEEYNKDFEQNYVAAHRNNTIVVVKSAGKYNVDDFRGYDCLVVIPDNIPLKFIKELI